jgi:hypothetical protein
MQTETESAGAGRETMTPTQAHDLFVATCLRIVDAGVCIRGLDVRAIEFHRRQESSLSDDWSTSSESLGEDAGVAIPAIPVRHNPTGDVCSKCGSGNLTWSGTCKTCRDCGDAGGCG